jgi:hypothetical protein
LLTEEQVEKQARLLWEQREAYIVKYTGVKVTISWNDASESGRELMRKYARRGVTDWLKAH